VLPGYLLSLREGLEAALIIGIVFGVIRQMRRSELTPVVWGGVISAVVISLVTAFVLYSLGTTFEGASEQIFEGVTMFLAAGVLTWMIFWMQRQSSRIKSGLEKDVRQALTRTSSRALFLIAFLAIVREGIELSLFLTATTFTSSAGSTLIGALLGLVTAVILGWMLYTTSVRLDLRRFFQITGMLLILFAAGLVAHGIHEFNEAGLIPSVIEPLWDINYILPESSILGQMMKALFGYNGNPSLTEVAAYITYFVIILLGLRKVSSSVPTLQKI
jgi:high-affinity iron transporter